ncbi:MAG: hypothetical protein R3Y04_01695 [Rikenellaceae bacterium]
MNTFLTITETSNRTGFSELQIWALIKKKLVDYVTDLTQTKVDYVSIRNWMLCNNSMSVNMILSTDTRNPKFSFSKRLKATKKPLRASYGMRSR